MICIVCKNQEAVDFKNIKQKRYWKCSYCEAIFLDKEFYLSSNDEYKHYLTHNNDVNDPRGFTIFDTETVEHKHVDNPYRMFYNVYYEDTPHQLFDASEYKDKIVKVIVRKKTEQKRFECPLKNSGRSV